MGREFVNWSGSLAFTPAEYAEPADEDEVRRLVARARESGTTIRPVGSGHSSNPLVRSDGILVSLDRLAGVLHDDGDLATVGAGTRIKALGEGLYEAGLAMDNLGDEHPDLLPAVRLSLGALGVVTRLTLDVQPRYDLRRRAWCAPVDWTPDHLAEMPHTNRKMDFYWYPRSDLTQIRTLNREDGPADGPPRRRGALRRCPGVPPTGRSTPGWIGLAQVCREVWSAMDDAFPSDEEFS